MRIGVDVGGSHIGLGLVNKDGKLVLKAEKDYDKIQEDMSNIVLETIIELINKIISVMDNNELQVVPLQDLKDYFSYMSLDELNDVLDRYLNKDKLVVRKLKKY